MKTDLLAQTTDDECASTDTTSEYSLITAESPDIENVEKLRERLKTQDVIILDFEKKLTDAENNISNQNEKISLYEATIRDKNDLIELIKETKKLAIKQLEDQIADLQNAPNLSKNLTSNEDDANADESAEFEQKPTENADFQELQQLFVESQSQNETLKDIICQLQSTNLDLKSKLDETIKQMAILKLKSNTEELKLRAKIAELEKNVKIYEARSKTKTALNTKSGKSTDPYVLLNHSKVPNIKFIKIGNRDTPAIVEDIPGAGPDWTVILRRFDGSIDFDESMVRGIGDLHGEFWFGLEFIHKLTSSTRHELYIEVVDFDNVKAYARYDNFVVGSYRQGYSLNSLGAYSGNAGDALRSQLDAKVIDQGIIYWWWKSSRNQCCLTGTYVNSRIQLKNQMDGMFWGNWCMGNRYSLKACKMLIRAHPSE